MSAALTARMLAATDQASRPERMVDETFEAFRLLRDGEMRFEHTKPTLEECRDLAALGTPHKQQFAVKHTDLRSGAVTLHVYQVKQKSTPRWVYVDHVPQRAYDRYAEEVSVVRIVEPQYPDEIARRVAFPGRCEGVLQG